MIFVAKSVVVGWYSDAKVYGYWPKPTPKVNKARENCAFCCEAEATQAVLLPSRLRSVQVPRGKGGMGQANVGYIFDQSGEPRHLPWLKGMLQFIRSYEGPNLLTEPTAEVEEEVADLFERASLASQSQGFLVSQEARRAVEERAMKVAEEHYLDAGYHVTRKGKPYDLLCTKDGKTLYVEVKGTQGAFGKIILTPNEVRWATDKGGAMSLFVLHSVKVQRKKGGFLATGGVPHCIEPWKIKENRLAPITYWYELP